MTIDGEKKLMDEALEESTFGYGMEVFFSTDGKHTVRMICDTDVNKKTRKKAIAEGINLYKYLVKELGTKAEMWGEAIRGSKSGSKAQLPPEKEEETICPMCGSEMWDNRPKKATGEFSKKSPDFKCKNQECGHVIWPKKPTRAGGR